MFEKTTLKLTAVYLAIIMAISLFFSFNVYRISIGEFNRNLRLGQAAIVRIPATRIDPSFRDQLLQERFISINEAKERVFGQLMLVNLLILVGGGLLSYYLARRTLAPIEESHQALERFTADASHELRTPIAAMQSEIEVSLMDPKLSLAGAKKQLHSNLEELDRLTALVDGLLRLASLENNHLEKQSVKLSELVDKATNKVTTLAQDKKVTLTKQTAADASVLVHAESLVEALTILLDNAIKYSDKGSEVIVSTVVNAKQATINVEDHGIGINNNELKHIFERFYRTDRARAHHQTNSYGLGLAIAQDIVTNHGGHLAVSSKVGQGSTFSVSLPT